jgi:hypothetical protein
VRKSLLWPLKFLISGLLLWFMLRHVNLQGVKLHFTAASVWPLAAAFIVLATSVALTAWRWSLVLAIICRPFTVGRLIPYAFIGFFFSQGLPSTIGGDGVRAWLVYRDGVRASVAVRSVLIERALGLMVLILFAASGLPRLTEALALDILTMWMLEALIVFGLATGIAVLLVVRRMIWLDRYRIGRGTRALALDFIAILNRSGLVCAFVLMTIAGQVNGCIAIWCISYAINSPVAFIDTLVVMPMVFLILALPISIGGWGVREGAMLIGLGVVGISSSNAVLMSVLFGLVNLAVGLLGGAIWLFSGRSLRSIATEATSASGTQ